MMCYNSLIFFIHLLLILCFHQLGVLSSLTPCETHDFRCKSGQCIDEYLSCDGIPNCDDGSDEIADVCANLRCPSYTYRCAYGACISSNHKCDGVEDCADGSDEMACNVDGTYRDIKADPEVGCTLPNHPVGGIFKILNSTSYTPGTVVPSWSIIIGECNKGYVQINKAIFYYCSDNSKWNDEISTDFCVEQDNSESARSSISKLTNCGKRSINERTRGNRDGEYPWVIGVYKKSQYICGGTLISSRFVLSAAHCFTDPNDGKLLDKHQYTVFAGITYRGQDHPENRHKQTSKVKSVRIHDFGGLVQNYVNDIALVELETPLNFSDYVLPVCLDWENKYLTEDLREDNLGIVANFGTPSSPSGTDILKETLLPFHMKNVCLRHVPDDFGLKYFTFDKICAGFTDTRNGLCLGDGGSGLYFKSTNDIYYIRGVASASPRRSENSNCFPITFFTDVSRHLQWIKEVP